MVDMATEHWDLIAEACDREGIARPEATAGPRCTGTR